MGLGLGLGLAVELLGGEGVPEVSSRLRTPASSIPRIATPAEKHQ